MHASTLISELNALLRLTNTEIAIAEARRPQAGSPAVESELTENAQQGRERVRLITTAIRELGGVPDVVGIAAGRLGALAKSQLEQGQKASDALLGDLGLEQQLHARARFLKVLAEAADQRAVVRVAERLERAHAETVEWLEIRIAELGLGGPAAIRPTPAQVVVGAARRVATVPVRGATIGLNRSIRTLTKLRQRATESLEEQLARAEELRDVATDVATAGRNAVLRRAEDDAEEHGADATAEALHATRAAAGALDDAELPVEGYEGLNQGEAVQAIENLRDADEVRVILGHEEAHANRGRVVSAAQARMGALAQQALDGEDATAPTKKAKGGTSKAQLRELTVLELREKAVAADIDGRSGMSKADLVDALARA